MDFRKVQAILEAYDFDEHIADTARMAENEKNIIYMATEFRYN